MFNCFCHVKPVVADTPAQIRKAKHHASSFPVRALPLIMLVLGLMFGTLKISAQESTADVVGTVTDSTGAVVPNAKVTVKNVNTGITRTANSNNKGDYLFTFLNVGTYQVDVEARGFRTFIAKDIHISAGDRARIDAKLEIGAASETVSVSGSAAPALDTDSSAIGSLIPSQTVQDLPLDGRNLTDLVRLAPGVSSGSGATGMAVGYAIRTEDSRPYSGYVANGQQSDTNNNMLDGGDNNEVLYGTSGARPSLDAVEEVKVQTNLYSADVGRTAGGAVDVITKSGTNAFHGSLYEFLRNNIFDSKTITGEANKPELRQNQFGGSLGGPIKKDKTFFFGDYEGFRQVAGQSFTALVPYAGTSTYGPEAAGDFSQLAYGQLCEAPSGGGGPGGPGGPPPGVVRREATGSAPACLLQELSQEGYSSLSAAGINNFDPLGVNLLGLYPKPNANLGTSFSDLENGANGGFNFEALPRQTQYSTTLDGRIDQHFSQSDTLSGHYTINNYTTTTPTDYPGVAIGGKTYYGGAGQAAYQRVQKLTLDEVHIFRPTLLLDLKASYLRYVNNVLTLNAENAATNLGWPCNGDSCINSVVGGANFGLPAIQNGSNLSYGALGDTTSIPFHTSDNTYQYSGAVTWTHGNHAVKTGANLTRRLLLWQQAGNGTDGQYQIDGAATGNYITDLLIGAATGLDRGTMNVAQHLRDWEPNAYAQDDWRIRRWLTLNLGVRWELLTPYTELNGYMANFDPVSQLIVSPILPGANHSSSTMGIPTQYHDFAPRVGFSASLKHNMVVRGGFGMTYYEQPSTAAQGASMLFQNNIGCGNGTYDPMAGQNCNLSNPALQFTNTTAVSSAVDPGGFAAGLQSQGYGQLSAGIMPPWSLAQAEANILAGQGSYPRMILPVSMQNVTPYLEQWSLQVEKQYGANVLTLGYVGNAGRHSHVGLDINEPTTNNGASPLSQMGGDQVWMNETIGSSLYNSMQLLYSRRFAQGLTSNVSYTWSHNMALGVLAQMGPPNSLECPRYGCQVDNPYTGTPTTTGTNYDYGNSDLDLRHRITYMTSYDLPFGKSEKGFLGAITKGWGVSTSGYWQSGTPFSVTYNGNLLGAIMGPRADELSNFKKISNTTLPDGSSCSPTTGAYFNTCAFSIPTTSGYLGNQLRNQLFGPHTWSVNQEAGKTFTITEKYKLTFREEAFNLTNTTNDAAPSGTLGSTTFGEIIRTGSAGRQFQFALRLSF
jgi:hypothetical protein